MVKHIVAFKLNGTDAERKEIAEKFKAALMALPPKIEVLKSIEVGINENPNESWDLVLTAIVEKMEDVEKYAKHPAHLAAAALLGTHKENRACVDYQF
jgi:hypothetical protein